MSWLDEASDLVRISGISVMAIHGVYEVERHTPQLFVVDVLAALVRAPERDELSLTIDYADLSTRIEREVQGPPVQLIETLAERIAVLCLGSPLIEAVEITVHKPQAQMPADVAGVSVTVRRRRSS
ncbi:MAG: dihydroneopterin aldolase [Micropruina sp.]